MELRTAVVVPTILAPSGGLSQLFEVYHEGAEVTNYSFIAGILAASIIKD